MVLKNNDEAMKEMESRILEKLNSNQTKLERVSTKPTMENVLMNRHILALIIGIAIIITGGNLMKYSYSYILSLHNLIDFGLFSNIMWINLLYFGLVFLILSFVVLNILPLRESSIDGIMKFETWIYILVVIGYTIFILVSTNSVYTSDEIISNTKSEINSSFSNMIKTISCSFSPTCIQEKMKSNTAKVVNNAQYEIKLKNPYDGTYLSINDLDKPLEFYYLVESTGPIKLNSVSCYVINSKNKEVLASSFEIDSEYNTFGNSIPINFKCSGILEALSSSENLDSIKLIFKLNLNVESVVTQQVPVVDYKRFILEESKIAKHIDNPSYETLKSELDDYTKDIKEFNINNNAIKVDDSSFLFKLPILINDDVESEINFPLNIEKNPSNSFGDLNSTRIIEFRLPEVLEFTDSTQDYYLTMKSKDNKVSKMIYLKEKSGIDYGTTRKQDEMYIKFDSNFIKEDRVLIKLIGDNS